MIHHGSMFDFMTVEDWMLHLGLQRLTMRNVNVSKFGESVTGPGGFINITRVQRKSFMLKLHRWQ